MKKWILNSSCRNTSEITGCAVSHFPLPTFTSSSDFGLSSASCLLACWQTPKKLLADTQIDFGRRDVRDTDSWARNRTAETLVAPEGGFLHRLKPAEPWKLGFCCQELPSCSRLLLLLVLQPTAVLLLLLLFTNNWHPSKGADKSRKKHIFEVKVFFYPLNCFGTHVVTHSLTSSLYGNMVIW